jgi:hypothetical protein
MSWVRSVRRRGEMVARSPGVVGVAWISVTVGGRDGANRGGGLPTLDGGYASDRSGAGIIPFRLLLPTLCRDNVGVASIGLKIDALGLGMRRHTTLCAAAVTCLLTGCNQPAVTPKPPAFQNSENTVRDWNNIAARITDQMAALGLLDSPGQHVTNLVVPPRPVFVRVQAPDSMFLREVANELESDILQTGARISLTPNDATVVNLDVDFIRWSPRDKPPGLLGTTAALAAIPGIVVGDSTPMATWTAANAAGLSGVGFGVLADGIIALTPTMNAEAIWKATVIVSDQVVMNLHEQVYIRAGDIPLYAKSADLAPIASWSRQNQPLSVRQIRYDP